MSRRFNNPLLLAAFAIGGAAALTKAAVTTARIARSAPIAPGSVVLVTGGSRGLGFALASRFAQQSVKLVLVARDRGELEEAELKLLERHPNLRPEDFFLITADLAAPEDCRRTIQETMQHFGRIDVLINNAGIIGVGPIESQTPDDFERTMRINFLAAMHLTWAALPHLRQQVPLAGKRRATIVNIASIGGKMAVPHMLPYSAAKFALVGFSQGLHAELFGKGIHVTTVCPGLMRTGGEDHAEFLGNKTAEQGWFQLAAKTPGIATSAAHAANRIYKAVVHGRAEIAITPQAQLAARIVGISPEAIQLANGLTNRFLLPAAPESERRSGHGL